MFNYIDNKYSKTYFRLVEKALQRPIPHRHWRKRHLNSTYFEMHHIWPTSLGGPDTPDNHVHFTAKEHFVAHMLLTKMLTGQDKSTMLYALRFMLSVPKKMEGLRYMPTGRTYDIARRALAEALRSDERLSERMSKTNKGRIRTEETKKKISEGLLRANRTQSLEHRKIISETHTGKIVSEETKAKMKKSWEGRRERIAAGLEPRKPMSEQGRKNVSEGKKGIKLSEEHKANISKGSKKAWSEENKNEMLEKIRSTKNSTKQSRIEQGLPPIKPISEEALENVRLAAQSRKGVPLTEEHKAKIKVGAKNKKTK